MKTCKNCGAKMSCACKRRIAKDGKECCTQCVATYNNSLSNIKASSDKKTN